MRVACDSRYSHHAAARSALVLLTAFPAPSALSTKSTASKINASEAKRERYFMKWLSIAAGYSPTVSLNLGSNSARQPSKTSCASASNLTYGTSPSSSARTESLGTEVGEILEYVIRSILGLKVGPAVDRIVAAEIRVHEYLKALEETVSLLSLLQGVGDVGRERTGLNATEDRNADGRDVQRASPYPIDAERAVAVPRLEVEGAVGLPAGLVQRA